MKRYRKIYALLLSFMVFFSACETNKATLPIDEGFHYSPWGASLSEVREAENKTLKEQSDGAVTYILSDRINFGDDKGSVDAEYRFTFDELAGELTGLRMGNIVVSIPYTQDSIDAAIDTAINTYSYIVTKYGEPSENISFDITNAANWKNAINTGIANGRFNGIVDWDTEPGKPSMIMIVWIYEDESTIGFNFVAEASVD